MPGSYTYGRHLKLGEKWYGPGGVPLQSKTSATEGPTSTLKVLQGFYFRQEDVREAHLLASFHPRGINFTISKAVPQ